MTEATTQTPDSADDADRALKAKHRTMWAWGDYAAVASEVIADLGPVLVEAAGVESGDRVLDVAAGTGNASLPAAATGAQVVASDLTPELLDQGRKLAEDRGLTIEWQEADAEALPFEDGSFDRVISCVGVMFAPHHQKSADELLRVTRPGGTIGLISWTPAGYIGQLFGVMKPYAPPPPPGAQPAPLWGDEEHVRSLFGDRVVNLVAERRNLRVTRFARPEEFRDFFKAYYGPTLAVFKAIAEDPEKIAALDEALVELARRNDIGGEGSTVQEWEYLLVTCQRP